MNPPHEHGGSSHDYVPLLPVQLSGFQAEDDQAARCSKPTTSSTSPISPASAQDVLKQQKEAIARHDRQTILNIRQNMQQASPKLNPFSSAQVPYTYSTDHVSGDSGHVASAAAPFIRRPDQDGEYHSGHFTTPSLAGRSHFPSNLESAPSVISEQHTPSNYQQQRGYVHHQMYSQRQAFSAFNLVQTAIPGDVAMMMTPQPPAYDPSVAFQSQLVAQAPRMDAASDLPQVKKQFAALAPYVSNDGAAGRLTCSITPSGSSSNGFLEGTLPQDAMDTGIDASTLQPTNAAGARVPKKSSSGRKNARSDREKKMKTAGGITRIAGYKVGFGKGEAPQETADLPLLRIGAVELLLLFPNHTLWPKVLVRLMGNGWTTEDISRAALHGRGLLVSERLRRRVITMRQQTREAFKIEFGSTRKPTYIPAVKTYDASAYVPRRPATTKLHTEKLVEIGRTVRNWPGAEDMSIVTKAVQLALQLNDSDWTTDDISQIAQDYNLTMPGGAANADWDQQGRLRLLASTDPVPSDS